MRTDTRMRRYRQGRKGPAALQPFISSALMMPLAKAPEPVEIPQPHEIEARAWKGPRVPKKTAKAAERRRVKLARKANRDVYSG